MRNRYYNPWQRREIKENLERYFMLALYPIIFVLVTLLINYFFDWKLQWDVISPIEVGMLPKLFLSAISFVTIGAWLYYIKFYRGLYRSSKNYRAFKSAKKDIWTVVMIASFILIKVLIFLVNKIFEFFYNSINIILFVSP
jgi:hypothetical protein